MFLLGTLIKIITGWIAKRRYKPENDKSRLGEEKRRGNIEDAERAIGLRQLESASRRSNISPTEAPIVRETNHSVRKAGNSPRGIFKHLRRR